MLALLNSRLPPVDVGANFLIQVPDVDKGHLAPLNVFALVSNVNSDVYSCLGTNKGRLERLYARNEFQKAD